MPTEVAKSGETDANESQKAVSTSKLTSRDDASVDEATTGVAYWEKRRAEWLQESSKPRSEAANGDNGPGSRARARLEALLAAPLAEEDDMIWNDSVSGIWKGLSRGDRLKKNLPLPVLIKILRGAWLRDGTWPRNLPIPADDPNDMAIPEPPSRGQQWLNGTNAR
ncbi:SubName: Full=Uncharacterized protein {ECO:0000313/EMBL:CCA66605.1} [Serendipita indica DSM 11827]|uniref:Gag1-like clamp domain-containing protein n=1 Tax=Serendipita indica (strain DSM 11827) TaxID=1109443 RepID=G4T5M3_SERID|nr:SubName: Full=Uncharacterized protein {ECO:0000313/EMBL:CCA66605.1} [Serendipita indica DSM 11827]CCA66605.1 hypothetical protein PIIN_00288 [Serendipita indica DSM 11827]